MLARRSPLLFAYLDIIIMRYIAVEPICGAIAAIALRDGDSLIFWRVTRKLSPGAFRWVFFLTYFPFLMSY